MSTTDTETMPDRPRVEVHEGMWAIIDELRAYRESDRMREPVTLAELGLSPQPD